MCPHPPTLLLQLIADNASAPQNVREAAKAQIDRIATAQKPEVLKVLPSTAPELTTGNKDFTCTIYSLENKDFVGRWTVDGHLDEGTQVKDAATKREINTRALTAFPGVPLLDTRIRDPDDIDMVHDSRHKDKDFDLLTLYKVKDEYKLDPALKMTLTGFRRTYDLFHEVFKRNSIDGNGLEIRASIHLSRGFENAFWAPDKKQMVFGDGGRFDGRGWFTEAGSEKDLLAWANSSTKSPQDRATNKPNTERKDVWVIGEQGAENHGIAYLSNYLSFYTIEIIGHELTHGVVEHTAALGTAQREKAYQLINGSTPTSLKQRMDAWAAYSEAGTLNEHIADCFGIMAKHRSASPPQTAETGVWHLGVGRWSPIAMNAMGWAEDYNYMRTFTVVNKGVESPDKYPKHMRDLWPFYGQVKDGQVSVGGLDPHINMGIPNHAFYLAARDFKEKTWETVGKIWYDALVDPDFKKAENQTILGWRKLTLKYAEKHFPGTGGKGPNGKAILENAWGAVGV